MAYPNTEKKREVCGGSRRINASVRCGWPTARVAKLIDAPARASAISFFYCCLSLRPRLTYADHPFTAVPGRTVKASRSCRLAAGSLIVGSPLPTVKVRSGANPADNSRHGERPVYGAEPPTAPQPNKFLPSSEREGQTTGDR